VGLLCCAFLNIFNTATICYKQVNVVEMAEERKCDSNSGSSDQNRAHKTHSFEIKVGILKHTDNRAGHGEIADLLWLPRSKMINYFKNIFKIMENVKSVGSLQSIMMNLKRSVLIEEMEDLLKIRLDDKAQRRILVSQAIISAEDKSLEEKKEGCSST
jgi:hypothetical protein